MNFVDFNVLICAITAEEQNESELNDTVYFIKQ